MSNPTPEQLQAVQQFASENGRNWKERLRDAWLRADARIGGEPSHLLQQVRNQFGPSWLDSYSLPSEAGSWRYLDKPEGPPTTRHGIGNLKPIDLWSKSRR